MPSVEQTQLYTVWKGNQPLFTGSMSEVNTWADMQGGEWLELDRFKAQGISYEVRQTGSMPSQGGY